MLGLAILFGLFVWIVVTLIATIIGYKIGKKAHYPKIGALAGFMLTMGGWIVYWMLEFAYIQAKVSYLCRKEAGITVYVTPEQYSNRLKLNNFDNLPNIEYRNNNVFFNDLKYVGKYNNDRLDILRSNEYFSNFYISRRIFIDKKNRVILLKENSVRVFTPAIANDVSGLKFWNGFVKDCKLDEQAQFTNDLYLKYEGVLNE